MSASPKPQPIDKKPGSKKKLLILVVALLLVGAGAGGWFSGLIPKLLGKGASAEQADAAGEGHDEAHAPEHGAAAAGHSEKTEAKGAPVFMDMPDIVANLNTGGRRAAYVKLKAKLELAKAEDQVALTAALPRLLDLFQGYLREMRPEELRGTAGTYRLREELLARTNLAAPPVRVRAVLFTEMIVQ